MKSLSKHLNIIILLAGLMIAFTACKTKTEQKDQASTNPNIHTVSVLEVLQSPSYTYLKVFENDHDYWIAIGKREIKKGETYYYQNGMEMKNMESKELKRTFESILFVSEFSDQPNFAASTPATPPAGTPAGMPAGTPAGAPATMGKVKVEQNTGIKVDPAKGGITIARLFADRNKWVNKEVTVRGQVVKYNPDIMNKNWVHIQDGTNDKGSFDLTVTTQETFKVGDVATFKGIIALDKDFGAGYKYDVILEDAKKVNK
ncbi:MAG: hypothetical protein NTU44_11530 [Bacteroidetes bacterium]|nr:hypothetical protein [Bacteroidota bacterium]